MSQSIIKIARIRRFPVKGLTGESLESVLLQQADGIPGDRLFGFARFNSGFDPDNPEPLPKNRFVVLLNEAKLAGLKVKFDQKAELLEIVSDEKTHQFEMKTPAGRKNAELFLHSALRLSDKEPPVFVSSAPHRFTDVSVVSPEMMNAVSFLIRANIEFDGLPPFAELDAIGSKFSFADVELKVLSRTKRCAATEVNPETAERDIKIPYLIQKHLGHADMGVYAKVETGGNLSVGQSGVLV